MIGILVAQLILVFLESAEPSIVGNLALNGLNGEVGNFKDNSLWSTEKSFSCGDMNDDVCGCVLHNCSYHVAGGNRCIDKKSFCEMAFSSSWQNECRRENSFYSIGGSICHNRVQKGDCRVDLNSKSNFGMNLNGQQYTDSHLVVYSGHNETQQPITNGRIAYKNASFYGTSICKRKSRGNIVNVKSLRKNITAMDVKSLFWSYLEGKETPSNIDDDEGCLSFQIDFHDDGFFELNLKAAEMEYFHQKYRQFNVKFNGQLIFPEVDIALLSGSCCVAVEPSHELSHLKSPT